MINFPCTLEADGLRCKLTRDGRGVSLLLEDVVTGNRRGPAPLLGLEIHDHAERCPRRVEQCALVEAEGVDSKSVALHFEDQQYGIGLSLSVALKQGELVIRLDPLSVREEAPERFRLFVAEVLPDWLSVSPEGRLLLPVSGGVSCSPAGKPALKDRFLMYLEQPRWKLATLFPFAGASEGKSAAGVIATSGAADVQCHVTTDGHGNGSTGLAFSLRQHWPDPVDPVFRELRFFLIPSGKEPASFIAKRLRRHAIEDLGKQTLLERVEEDPAFAYQLKSIVLKLFHGMRDYGAAMKRPPKEPGDFINTLTFQETCGVLDALHAAGIPRISTQSVGWNTGGHDGCYPTRFPVEERLGGEVEFRNMLQHGHALGYEMQVHDNFQMNIPSAPDYDPDCVIVDMFGEPLMRGWWAGGEEYGTWYPSLPEGRKRGIMEKIRDLGVRGMYYCDYMMPPLEVNYHPRHAGGRCSHLQGQLDLLHEAREIFGSVSVEYPNFAGLVACDSVAIGGIFRTFRSVEKDWPIAPLLADAEALPMLPLVMSGLTLTQANGGPKWINAMRAIAFGQRPRDEVALRPIEMHGIHVFDQNRPAAIKALHDLCIERFGHLMTQEILSCELDEPDSMKTVFADGTTVDADFSEQQLVVNGEPVNRPPETMD